MAFTIVWTLIVGVFDGLIGFVLYKQFQAESYPIVRGEIVASSIKRSTDSEGDTTYRPIVEFRYNVDGTTYSETGHRYGSFSSSDRGYATRVVARYPTGSEVPVNYNPRKPNDAVLEVGVGNTEHALLLFFTPFNCVMFLLWINLGGIIRRRLTGADAVGVKITRRRYRTIVRMPRFAPLPTAVVAALGVSFASVFVVVFSSGLDPHPTVLKIVWALTGGAAVVAYFWRSFIVHTGAKDLVINHKAGTVTLPQTFGRTGDVWCSVDQVTRTRVKRVTHSGKSNETYAPMLHWRDADGQEHQEQLAEWMDENRAAQFIAWLDTSIVSSHKM